MGQIWTTEELIILRRHWKTEGMSVHRRVKRHTKTDCWNKAYELGLGNVPKVPAIVIKAEVAVPRRRPWSEDEDNVIREHYPEEGCYVARRLRHRTEAACYTRARILGVNYRRGEAIPVKKVYALR